MGDRVLAREMHVGEGWGEVHAGADRSRSAYGFDGDRFMVRGCANGHLAAHGETSQVAAPARDDRGRAAIAFTVSCALDNAVRPS